jgi:ribulose-5-phosphate 4-epimerase/fuculose-1-phosphate aldolase
MQLRRKLITANHILHYHDVVDAYGHISVRHPEKPDIYIMCGYMAPGVVSSSEDLIEYYVADGSTVDPNAKKGYSERFIHGEMFKKFPSVNCVIHSHAEAVLPYVTSGIPLLPVFHMAGFLGEFPLLVILSSRSREREVQTGMQASEEFKHTYSHHRSGGTG